jgi:hypothetical protein
MSPRVIRTATASVTAAALAAALGLAIQQPLSGSPLPSAPSVAPTPAGQEPPGGRGRGRGAFGPAQPARASAPVDLTGNWVSVVTEDWQWRMRTPAKGDYTSVPLTAEGRRVADTWDESKDGMCDAYGAGGIMRMPGRLRISWQDDNTLKIETDAGQQTRLLRFTAPGAAAAPAVAPAPVQPRTLQGTSTAEWQRGGGAFDAFLFGRGEGGGQRWGSLKVTTTNVLPGWLRRNGVPYSENAVITEHFTRFTHPEAGDWLVVTTIVEDPRYLAQPFITSSNFKKEADGSKWSPAPCRAG